MTLKLGRTLSAFPDRETARAWREIEGQFVDLARENPAFIPIADLASHLARSEFVKCGLCGATSMHDLVIGPSKYVFQNPHLRIEYDFDTKAFQMIYVDGSAPPWERTVPPNDVNGAVDRFLLKLARWYRAT